MEEGGWSERLRHVSIAAGALALGVPMFYLELDSAAGFAVAFTGFAVLMTGLYLWKRAADGERRRKRSLLEDVGGEADVAKETGVLPRRDTFEDRDR